MGVGREATGEAKAGAGQRGEEGREGGWERKPRVGEEMPSSAPLGGPRPRPPAVSQTEQLPVLGGQGLLRVGVPPSAGQPVGEGMAGKKRWQAGGRVAPRG